MQTLGYSYNFLCSKLPLNKNNNTGPHMKKSQYESPHWYEDGKNTLPRDPDTSILKS